MWRYARLARVYGCILNYSVISVQLLRTCIHTDRFLSCILQEPENASLEFRHHALHVSGTLSDELRACRLSLSRPLEVPEGHSR
jgi:hypothetical protein